MEKKTIYLKGKLIDACYMARDFFKIIAGRDYFHPLMKLGIFFSDGKSYYVDFRKKANWTGKYVDNVPVLYVPSLGKSVFFPSMIFQYGLGSIDMYFSTKDTIYLANIANVYKWILRNIGKDYSFNNLSQEIGKNFQYYSNNSAMTQGEALSFLIRVLKYSLVKDISDETSRLVKNIFENMILPLKKGGTAIYKEDEIYFCEFCKKDKQIILNGWIFAIFGLYDYQMYFNDPLAEHYLNNTLMTLEKTVKKFMLKNKWSYYDDKGRISSPIYQTLHIHLIDALYRLSKREIFKEICQDLREGNNWLHRSYYTFIKIKDKLKDSYRYSTVR